MTSTPESTDSPESHGLSRRIAQRTLVVLVLVNVMSQIDRHVMNVLLPEIKLDLGLSDTESGMLVGFAFAVCHSLAGVPLARVADRGSRRRVIAASLAVWSAMTAACGLARGFVELFVARIGVGIGEAGCSPAAQSLISDSFPAAERGRGLATYQLGVPIGILIGSVAGGALSDYLPWRTVFFIFGVPGLAFALWILMNLHEPARGAADGEVDQGIEPISKSLRFLWSRPAMRHVLIAATLHTLALGAHVTFNFSFLTRIHHLSGTEAGIVVGLLTGIFGGLGTYLGGWLGDRFGARDARWYLWVLLIGTGVSIPFSILAYLSPSVWIAVAALSLSSVGSYMYAGACHVVSQSLAKPRMRAITASIMLLSMNLIGYGLGPPIAGFVSDALGGADALRYALASMNIVLGWSCLHYGLASRTYRADLRAKTEWSEAG